MGTKALKIIMNNLYLLLLIFLLLLHCKTKNDKVKYVTEYKNGLRIDNYYNEEKKQFSIAFDKLGNISKIVTQISDSTFEELNFEINGSLYSKLIYNEFRMLHGNSYFFYPSGSLKSMRRYSKDKYYSRGMDYYDLNGIIMRNIFYDSTGNYYYRTDFSDTSTYYEQFFNPENPLSYLMIKKYAPEPTRTKLLKLIEGIGLDSLKQNY